MANACSRSNCSMSGSGGIRFTWSKSVADLWSSATEPQISGTTHLGNNTRYQVAEQVCLVLDRRLQHQAQTFKPAPESVL